MTRDEYESYLWVAAVLFFGVGGILQDAGWLYWVLFFYALYYAHPHNNPERWIPDLQPPTNLQPDKASRAERADNAEEVSAGRDIDGIRIAAEEGDVSAQLTLAGRYFQGDGVPRSPKESVKWYRLAAEQGDTHAPQVLSGIYSSGLIPGVPKDDAESARWSRLAAEQGNAVFQHSIGSAYAEGRGVPQDLEEAARWLRRSAEQGYISGQGDFGAMHMLGLGGLPQDDVVACMWLTLAVAQIVAKDDDGLAEWYPEREHQKQYAALMARMSQEDVAEAQRRAREWKPSPQPEP